jgi:predicted PurR-regulated permease PerM
MDGVRESRHVIYRAVLLAAGLVVLGLLFRQLVTLFLAVVMTIVIAIPLAAGADRLERRGIPRPLGVLACLVLGFVVLAGVLALVIPPFVDQTNRFIDDVPGIVNDLRDKVHDITGKSNQDIGDDVRDFLQGYVDDPAKLIGPITSIGLGVAGVLGALVLMIITAFYMATRPEPLVEGALSLFPPDRRDHALHVMRRLRSAWIGWMQGVVADMFISGTLLYIGLTIVGLDFAIVFAVITALLVVVPYFGAIAGAIPPVLFALTDSPGKALLVLGVYVLVQQIEGNLIIPLVMSRTVRLHPAVIAVGVVLVGQLFGFVGLFVAVPLLSGIVILADEFWVRPTERAHEHRRRGRLELPTEGEAAGEVPSKPAAGPAAEPPAAGEEPARRQRAVG